MANIPGDSVTSSAAAHQRAQLRFAIGVEGSEHAARDDAQRDLGHGVVQRQLLADAPAVDGIVDRLAHEAAVAGQHLAVQRWRHELAIAPMALAVVQ
jgi:hypothetical protein